MKRRAIAVTGLLLVWLEFSVQAGPPADLYKGGEDDGFDQSSYVQPGSSLCVARFTGSEEDGFDRNCVTNLVFSGLGMVFKFF